MSSGLVDEEAALAAVGLRQVAVPSTFPLWEGQHSPAAILRGNKPLAECFYDRGILRLQVPLAPESTSAPRRGYYECPICRLVYDLPLGAADAERLRIVENRA